MQLRATKYAIRRKEVQKEPEKRSVFHPIARTRLWEPEARGQRWEYTKTLPF